MLHFSLRTRCDKVNSDAARLWPLIDTKSSTPSETPCAILIQGLWASRNGARDPNFSCSTHLVTKSLSIKSLTLRYYSPGRYCYFLSLILSTSLLAPSHTIVNVQAIFLSLATPVSAATCCSISYRDGSKSIDVGGVAKKNVDATTS